MSILAEIRSSLAGEWLPIIYKEKIRTQRTRAVELDIPERENAVEIEYTLLGIEIKVGRCRIACPDLATARYMRVFARLGCRAFAIPYDISTISPLADELETSWQRTLLHLQGSSTGTTRTRSQIIKAARNEVAEIGPGDVMPKFDRETRQRPS